MSEKLHLDAAIAAINAAQGEALSIGDIEKIKADKKQALPPSYNEVMVMERFPDGPRRGDEPSETTQWRILTRAVAQKYANAVEMRARARAGLLGTTLTIGTGETAVESTPVERLATDDPIAPDDGWFSGTSEFGYAT
jgi:hypothetical protein